MKIAYLMRYWPVYGGGETVTRILVNELAERNHNVSVIYLWDRNNSTSVEINTEIKEIKLEDIKNINDGDIDKKDYKKIFKQLKKLFNNERFDIIVNQWLPSKQVYQAANDVDSKVIKCHHGAVDYVPIINTLKQKIFYGLLGKKAGWIRVYWQRKEDYIYSDKWVFLCDSFVEDAKKLLKIESSDKLCAIPNPLPYGIDASSIDFSKKKHRVLYVGRMVGVKRVHFLLDAWQLIQDDSRCKDWDFVLVGDGVTLENEKSYAHEIGCKRVSFTGFKDPSPYYKEASILTMASNREGFGMVLVEAQQYGCVPVALDSFSAVHDIISNNENGILVKDNDLHGYADALLNLIEDDTKRKKIAEKALVDCKKFSKEYIVDMWEQLFKEVVS